MKFDPFTWWFRILHGLLLEELFSTLGKLLVLFEDIPIELVGLSWEGSHGMTTSTTLSIEVILEDPDAPVSPSNNSGGRIKSSSPEEHDEILGRLPCHICELAKSGLRKCGESECK